jgi:hypothetical protein
LLLGALLVGAPTMLRAQDLSVLVGGVSARYADSVSGAAGVMSGRLRLDQGVATGSLDASVARFTSGEWATQLGVQGLAARARDPDNALGLVLGGSLNALQGGVWSTSVAGGPFIARSVGPFTPSVAVALGAARNVDSSTFLLSSLTLGARYDRGPWHAETAAIANGADTLRFLDWTTEVSWHQPALSLTASAGVRAGDLAGDPWGQVRLAAALNAWMSVEAAFGTYPRDVTGFTAGRFATLGLRVGLVRQAESAASRTLSIQRLTRGQTRVTLVVDDARSVAIAGDWNDWSPAPMARMEGGRWTAVIRVPPGVHRFALLLDGTRWAVPHGAPQVPDEFGGQVALLVIPGT